MSSMRGSSRFLGSLLATGLRAGVMAVVLACVAETVVAEEWSRFRGEAGAGISDLKGLPTSWTNDQVAWKETLPGTGHSSPVIRDGKLYVTSGNTEGTERYIHCLNVETGKRLWTSTLPLASDKLHAKNSYASATPAVDDLHVYVPFATDAKFVVAAYNFSGELIWTRDLGPFDSQHGHGASPIVYQGRVLVPDDQDGPSSIVALDAASGRTVWKTPRETGRTSYSTPFILEIAGQPTQLITSCDALGVTSLNPDTGAQLWSSGPLPKRTVNSPIFANGLIYQSCGEGGRGTLMIGVRPELKIEGPRVAFESTKALPYVPTPVAYQDALYLWADNGVVTCLDLKSPGKEVVWTGRVGGNFSSSPVCVNGVLYAVSESGEVVTVKTGKTFEVIGRSELGEGSFTTPAVAEGKLFLRTFSHVVCVRPQG